MRLWLFRAFILGVLVIIILSAWRMLSKAPDIIVVQPIPREVVELVVASGRLHAVQQSWTGLEVAGIVEAVHVREGSKVEQGQILLFLNHQSAEASLEQAQRKLEVSQAQLVQVRRGPLLEEITRARAQREESYTLAEQSRLDLERNQNLLGAGILSRAEYDQAQSTYKQVQAAAAVTDASLALLLAQPTMEDIAIAESQVREAEAAVKLATASLNKHFLIAPFSGMVIRREVEPGEMTTARTPLLHLADLNSLEIQVETDENNIARLKPGQTAVAIPPAYRDQPFNAILTRIGPEIDPARGVVMLRLQPEFIPDYALPDLTVDVNIEVARLESVLSLPVSSIIEVGGQNRVRVIENDFIRELPVQVLARGIHHVAIEGISPDTQVVLDGAAVRIGQKITAKLQVEPHV